MAQRPRSTGVPLSSSLAASILRRPLRLSGASGQLERAVEQQTNKHAISGHMTHDESRDPGAPLEPKCLSCGVTFDLREDQVSHYRLDWHRYNLKRKLKGLSSVSQDEFEGLSGDLSSISGSESDSEGPDEATPTDHTHFDNSPFLYFHSGDDPSLYSVYRVVLCGGKGASTSFLEKCLLSISQPQIWIILMRAGGHFAGAVFKQASLLAHKTFHRYTVRAKRGTAQSVRDSQSGGHGPKSAGASLRRYNETALEQDIQDLIASWASHVEGATVIFIRTPKHNRSTFIGGKKSPFSRDDPRIRGIPFMTRRPTLKEVKRVHFELSSIFTGKVVSMPTNTPQDSTCTVDGVVKNREEERKRKEEERKRKEEGRERKEEGMERDEEAEREEGDSGMEEEGEGGRKVRGRKKKKKAQQQKTKEEVIVTVHPYLSDGVPADIVPLLRVCETGGGEEEEEEREGRGDEVLIRVLQQLQLYPLYVTTVATEEEGLGQISGQETSGPTSLECSSSGQEISGSTTSGQVVSSPSGASILNRLYGGVSPLHVASECGHAHLVTVLLQYGADPTIRDASFQLPYLVAKEKNVRDSYRRFMAEHPLVYDYATAQVPSPLTGEMERGRKERLAEKKKERKRVKKEKQKQKKREREIEEVEEEQRQREEGVSEREKRALAAERRMAQQMPTHTNMQRSAGLCSYCSKSLTGLVPFHKHSYKYCSMECVRNHQTQLTAQ